MSITENLKTIEAEIAALKPQQKVRLIAVSKTKPLAMVVEAAASGQRAFGENYTQELVEKAQARPDLEWHFIGALQSNKTKAVAAHANWVHTVDRLKIAQRLNDQRPADLPSLNICLQINIDKEPQKAGCSIEEALELADAIAQLPRLKLRGLMAIPNPALDTEAAFQRLALLKAELNAKGLALDSLSMGMSGDYQSAIQYGATHIRVGTAIFGQRNKP